MRKVVSHQASQLAGTSQDRGKLVERLARAQQSSSGDADSFAAHLTANGVTIYHRRIPSDDWRQVGVQVRLVLHLEDDDDQWISSEIWLPAGRHSPEEQQHYADLMFRALAGAA